MSDKRPIVAADLSSVKIKSQGHAKCHRGERIDRSGKNDFSSCRYFKIAGITIRVASDLPIGDATFAAAFKKFQMVRPRPEQIRITHHFSLPKIEPNRLGPAIYRKAPWAIYRTGSSWSYLGIGPGRKTLAVYCLAQFNEKHTRARIFHKDRHIFNAGNLHSLSLFPTDQIWLARVLAERQGFYLHAAGMKIDGQGLLFAGHSGAGKSTTVARLQGEGEILCDDRIIVRRWPQGFKIHGTWSHGDVPQVSAGEAPLQAILFLEKAKRSRAIPMEDPREILQRLLPLLIKPLVTADWWKKTLAAVEKLVREIPAYRLQLDKSGKIKALIHDLVADLEKKRGHRNENRLP